MNETFSVFESAISINGEHLLVAPGRSLEKLPNGIILSSRDGRQWRIADNNFESINQMISSLNSYFMNLFKGNSPH